MKNQFIIEDLFYLYVIFNLHCEFLCGCTICILQGTISVGMFSISKGVMCIPVGTICIPAGMISNRRVLEDRLPVREFFNTQE